MLNAYAKQNTIQVRPRRQIADEKYEPIAVSGFVLHFFHLKSRRSESINALQDAPRILFLRNIAELVRVRSQAM